MLSPRVEMTFDGKLKTINYIIIIIIDIIIIYILKFSWYYNDIAVLDENSNR